jgi:hypothetical protein
VRQCLSEEVVGKQMGATVMPPITPPRVMVYSPCAFLHIDLTVDHDKDRG